MLDTRIATFLIALFFACTGLKAQTWDERPAASYNALYEQDFTTGIWDGPKLYNQWEAVQYDIFTESDITEGYLKFHWSPKRILTSRIRYSWPYILEAELNYEGGSN